MTCFQPFGAGGCEVRLPDGTAIPIAVHDGGAAWDWRVDGLLVSAAPIEAHVRGVLADLGVAQDVACGARLRRVAPGARVECSLARGGVAFVTIDARGKLAVELALDPAVATARRQAGSEDLAAMSRALDRPEAPPDGGVADAEADPAGVE